MAEGSGLWLGLDRCSWAKMGLCLGWDGSCGTPAWMGVDCRAPTWGLGLGLDLSALPSTRACP